MLKALVRAGGGRLRGIRFPVAWHPDESVRLTPQPTSPGLMRDARVQAGAAALARAGLSLDLWVGHTQLGEVFDLASGVPELTMIVDHVGGPIGVGPYAGRREEVLADWRAAMRRLAALPNIHVKLGGLAMRVGGFVFDESPLPPSSEELAARVAALHHDVHRSVRSRKVHVREQFPGGQRHGRLRNLWNGFKRLTAGFSEDEKHALFAGTARRVYGMAGDADG